MTNIRDCGEHGTKQTEIRVRGKNRIVPSAMIENETVVVANRWPRIACLKDEEFVENVEENGLKNPSAFMRAVKESGLGADLFTFVQSFPSTAPKYAFHLEWDNVAAVPVTTYADWLSRQINGNMRKILRRSSRRGVSVERVDFTDEFVRGVVEIYNETPVRQGRAFWHYGKDFQTVQSEASTYPGRSIFAGAFFESRLIGFIKIVLVGRVARLMHILSMESHADKLPTNALIAKAVEISADSGCSHLTYGKYIYGNAGYTSLTEFKARNGFREYRVPRYYVPLTAQGQLALKLGIHQGFKNLLPESILKLLLKTRAKYSSLRTATKRAGSMVQNAGAHEPESEERQDQEQPRAGAESTN